MVVLELHVGNTQYYLQPLGSGECEDHEMHSAGRRPVINLIGPIIPLRGCSQYYLQPLSVSGFLLSP